MEDQHPSANSSRDSKWTRISITEDEGEDHHQYSVGRRIHRVPDLVRFNIHNEEDYYAPKMVSFGPYYHGLPKLGMAEKFKHEVLSMFLSSGGNDMEFFYCQIFEVIDQIRDCYVGVSRDEYDDNTLAKMILLDASFAIYLMKISVGDATKYFHFWEHLGRALKPFAFQDLCLLDNQIPLWVIELLANLIYGNKEGQKLIYNFSISYVSPYDVPDDVLISITGKDKKLPLHLVAAFHQLLAEGPDLKNINFKSSSPWWSGKKENQYDFGGYNRQFRSVTDLKAKGIHFKPSSYHLKDIEFESYKFYGQLQLPLFSIHSKQFILQMIAYEASPDTDVGTPIIISYVNFLKTLIVKSEDVKELREKKILFSTLDSDEQVVEEIKGINTCGLLYDHIFYEVKMSIEEHCSSKAKTWIAELMNTYFRSPWKFIALLAATFLLCLTFLQTYYTMNFSK